MVYTLLGIIVIMGGLYFYTLSRVLDMVYDLREKVETLERDLFFKKWGGS